MCSCSTASHAARVAYAIGGDSGAGFVCVAQVVQRSCFLAVYSAGLSLGTAPSAPHTVVAFLDAPPGWRRSLFRVWGFCHGPYRSGAVRRRSQSLTPWMFFARSVASSSVSLRSGFTCAKAVLSWSACAVLSGFLASLPLLVGLRNGLALFRFGIYRRADSLLSRVGPWTGGSLLTFSLPRSAPLPRRVELDLAKPA